MNDFFIEKATISHSKLIWKWRNDEETRSMSLNSEFINWLDHKSWFANILNDINTYIYLGKFKKKIIGVIRFNKIENASDIYEVNINIAPDMRGKGYGKILLNNGIKEFSYENKTAKYLKAKIKNNNNKSKKIFFNSGFKETSFIFNKISILELKIL